jgi:hypothetical protein
VSAVLREHTPRVGESLRGYDTPQATGTPRANFAVQHLWSGQTLFATATAIPEFTRIDVESLTPAGEDTRLSEPPRYVHEAEEGLDMVTQARDRRLELLVRQFDRQSTPEDDARFHILTQRLRRLVPSVSDAAWEALNATTTALENVSSSLDHLKNQFGLR